MFFKVFLLMVIFAKVSAAAVAEQDFYKHYDSDDYGDYEYNDELKEISSKKNAAETDLKKDAGTINTNNIRKLVFVKENDSVNDSSDPSTESYDDAATNIVTDKFVQPDSKRPVSSYEVVEDVDDIPNNATFRPIVANFTIKLPLNNATGIVNTNNENSDKNGIFNFLYNKDKNDKDNLRKNSISIFHVNAEFDDDKDDKPVVQNIHIHKIPFGIFKVKDHIDKFKDDVINYGHNTEEYNYVNPGYYLPNILAGPKDFLRKLKDRGSAFFHKYF